MKMIAFALVPTAAACLFAAPALAETFEVKMLNRSDKGSMVFEPDYLENQPGDQVSFVVGNKGHNAATIDGMTPSDTPGFKGKINQELTVTLDKAGFYGVKCSPHYGMGMVMLIKVGEADFPPQYRTQDIPPRARPRLEALFDRAESDR
jgi:pseudoazurin